MRRTPADSGRTPGIPTGLLLFYGLALAISWAIWIPLAAGRLGWLDPQPAWLHLAGSLGPALAAVITARWQGQLASLLAGLAPRRLSGRALVAAVLLPLGIGAAGLMAQTIIEGTPLAWHLLLVSNEFPQLGPVAVFLCSLVFYGLGEEIGWRGFLLPRLMRRCGVFAAALIATLPWAFWHLPLLVSSPTYRALGLAGLAGWLLSMMMGSFLMTWLFLAMGRSLLAVALFHAILDLVMVNPATDGLGINMMGALVTLAGLGAAAWAWQARVDG